jgi:hypothetical protein
VNNLRETRSPTRQPASPAQLVPCQLEVDASSQNTHTHKCTPSVIVNAVESEEQSAAVNKA